MKKIVALFLAMALCLAVFSGCGSSDNTAKTTTKKNSAKKQTVKFEEITDKYAGKFRVGFSRVNVTPYTEVPLAGYGNSEKRLSTGFLDYIYTESIAVSDEDNNTVLFMRLDSVGLSEAFDKSLRQAVSYATNIPLNNIFLNCSHSHSCPDTGNAKNCGYINTYNAQLATWMQEAAISSLNDRVPAKAFYGSTEATGINFVRHYFAQDGGVVSDNHDTRKSSSSPLIKHTTDADPTLYILKFAREGKKDVIYANWRAHAQLTGGSSAHDISADWIAPFRDKVEKQFDCYCAYYQGAAGNINASSRIDSEYVYHGYKAVGEKLADYLIASYDKLKEVETGTIKTSVQNYTGQINHANDSLLVYAKLVQAEWTKNNNSTTATALGKPYGIYSPYHANRIANNAKLAASDKFSIYTATIGKDLAFTFVPFEQFDTNACYVIENSPYKYTFANAYSNGKFGYVASSYAYDYGTYEVDIGKYAKGTGEGVATALVNMLKKSKAK